MLNTYYLINPHIEGLFDKKIKAKNSKEAASIFYTQLGDHINNSIPSFYFTIQKGSSGNGSLYSFQVKEEKKDNQVNFTLEPTSIKGDEELTTFKNKLEEFKLKINNTLKGGKSKKHKKHKKHNKHKDHDNNDNNDNNSSSEDSSSSSSSSSDEVYKKSSKYINNLNVPIYYWWYYPYLYETNSIYIPTFYSYITPYIELSL